MAPYQCPKQVLIWSLPTLAVLISLFWYRRRKPSLKSDPGGKQPTQSTSLGDINCSAKATAAAVNSETVGELLSAIEKARRDLETSQPIAEVNSLEEEESKQATVELSKQKNQEKPKVIDADQSVNKAAIEDKTKLCEKKENKVQDCAAVEKVVAVKDSEVVVGEKNNPGEVVANKKVASKDSEVVVANCREEKVQAKVAVKDTEVVVANCKEVSNLDLKPVEEVCTSVHVKKQETGVKVASQVIDLDNSSSGSSDDCIIVEESNLKLDKVIDLTSSSESLATGKKDAEKEKMALEIKQEQHDEFSVDRKLSSLELQSSHDDGERDSANHSPAEIMLESPALRNFSDAHSEGSSDSGKGCSDVATPPAGGSSVSGEGDGEAEPEGEVEGEGATAIAAGVFEFIIPQHLVGRLIGRHGAFLQEIRSTTHTNVFIKRHPDTAKLKICAIEGAQADIDAALSMIRHKFPLRRYPSLTLEKVTFVQVAPTCELAPEQFRLQLVEGVNNDVILSSLVSAGHMFLQQPTHPSFQQLAALNQLMNANYCYNDSPSLEVPVKDGVCAAPAPMGGWYRAQIVNVNDDEKTVDLRFLDYGGYISCEYTILKKMRYDFLLLPFQAVECCLANVTPVGGSVWSEEATLFVQNLIYGKILQAQIYDYTEDGMPLIYLYATCGNQVVLVNQELVASGYAEPVTPPTPAQEQQQQELKVEE
ncbi:hypothetical protein LSTR_LSTR010189 [Laodelphax striatellus]|uniref:Tudor domain-containing protein n=1 Tax=Laodelphax striatellus TaxID=195883 RepID=A0A482WPS9_LAOST|nr:hypothetical protein LSTR_LSTR010189 [Laodelphax striatellus]